MSWDIIWSSLNKLSNNNNIRCNILSPKRSSHFFYAVTNMWMFIPLGYYFVKIEKYSQYPPVRFFSHYTYSGGIFNRLNRYLFLFWIRRQSGLITSLCFQFEIDILGCTNQEACNIWVRRSWIMWRAPTNRVILNCSGVQFVSWSTVNARQKWRILWDSTLSVSIHFIIHFNIV